jgi:hypothetical protein
MYHSITFGTKNTWDDWHLIPASRPVINPPTVKTNYVEIPGGDGILDLTTALSGRPTYKNRTGSFEFHVENGFKDWSVLYSEIMVHLQGQKMRLTLEDDPAYYYEGRFSVNQWKSDPQNSLIVIDYDVSPYKRESIGSTDDWLWDTFNFETGVIRYYKDITIGGTKMVRVIGSFMPTTVIISASNAAMTVRFNGEIYALPKGPSVVKEIVILNGENELTFTGNGVISIEYSGGGL